MSEQLQAQLDLLPGYLSSHLLISLSALGIGLLICLPLAVVVTRVQSLHWPTLTFASVMQTIPGIALLALMVPLLATIGFLPALVALVLYSMLPILRNTVTGILEVDPNLIEAADGLGMTSMQKLFRVELPLAAPVIIAGIRTSTVWVVGTATLSTPVGATSLGNFIFPGLQTQNATAVLVGSAAAAGLAIVLDQLIRLIEVASQRRSKGLGLAALSVLAVLIVFGLMPKIMTLTADRDRPTVVVGTKQFTEQYILGELISRTLDRAGFTVDLRPGLGTTVLFDAISDGSIDCYVDYSGTIWSNVMNRTDNPSADSVMSAVTRRLDSDFEILCLGPLGFENAYALAARGRLCDSLGISSISDLASHANSLVLGTDYDFPSRPEWASVRDRYGLAFDEIRQFDATLMYTAIGQGEVDVISAYSTDGRIADLDLLVLEDPFEAFPPYDAVILLSPRARHNENLTNALSGLIESISDDAMRQSNRRVDVDNETISAAADYLEERMK